MPMGTRTMNRHGLPALQPAPICGMPSHRERLDQRAFASVSFRAADDAPWNDVRR